MLGAQLEHPACDKLTLKSETINLSFDKPSFSWKGQSLAGWLLVTVLVLAVISSGLTVWTGGLGGQIRHTEIRVQP